MIERTLAGARLPLAVGLVLTAVGLAAWHPSPVGIWHDDGVYALLGQALADGEGLVYAGVPGSPPATKFPPLYPSVLAGVWWLLPGVDAFAKGAEALNLLFLVMAGALFATLARDRLGLRSGAAFATSVLGWFSYDLWSTSFVPLSEPLFVLMMVLALWYAAHLERPDGKGLGLLTAALVLLVYVRTAGVAIVAAVCLGLWVRGRRREALIVGAGSGAALVPWWLWTASASARIPESLSDILGSYSGWLASQVSTDPGGFVLGLFPKTLGLGASLGRTLMPGAESLMPEVVLGGVTLLLLGVGGRRLARRSPGAAWALGTYLAMIAIWPFFAPRLLVPLFPLAVLALVVAWVDLHERFSSPSARRASWAIAAAWALLYVGGGGGRLFGAQAGSGHAVRERQLIGTMLAIEQAAPQTAIVGAPELWPAIPLYTNRLAVPSAPFRPAADEGPVWGDAEAQIELWLASEVGWVVLEQGGSIHAPTLDRIEAACPGAVTVRARWEGQSLVSLDWDADCRRRWSGG